jgi:phage terminase large subunit-like protein
VNVERTSVGPRARSTRPPAGVKRDYQRIADRWERDVLAGKFPAGELVHLAIERQQAERLEEPEGYTWDEKEASKACAIAEELHYPKGPKRGEPFILEAWEIWFLRAIFGWVDSVSRLPRFHRITVYLPKGNGKSPLAAAIGVIVLARGKGIGAKVFSAAVAEKQAANVFEPAQEMLRLSPKFREAAGLVVGEHSIRGIGDPRSFKTVSAEKKSADGSVGDCYIVDEVHQHPTRDLYDVLANNASKVDGSRIIVISTAGTDPSPTAIGWELYVEARAVLRPDEAVEAPRGDDDESERPEVPGVAHFVLIFEADRKRPDGSDASPWDEATWRQANPNFGVSISVRNFRTTAEGARKSPSAQPHFFATRLGWWSRGASKWMDPLVWDAAKGELDLEQLRTTAVFIGVDYAPKLDLSALVPVCVTIDDHGRRHYTARCHCFLPEGSQTLLDLPELRQWSPDWLTLTPGTVLDAGYLRPRILEILKEHEGAEQLVAGPEDEMRTGEVCLDPYGAVELMASLPAEGVEPVEIKQTWQHHSPAMKEVEVALAQGRIVHDGSPLMLLAMNNVRAKIDRNGNSVPDRDNANQKIDPVVALLNAIYRASTATIESAAGPIVWSAGEAKKTKREKEDPGEEFNRRMAAEMAKLDPGIPESVRQAMATDRVVSDEDGDDGD